MSETSLYMLTEHSVFMMGFVFITENDRCIVVDGGRPEDMPYLFEIIGDREIAAWLLTHPHLDHISGLTSLIRSGEHMDQVKKVYHNFVSVDYERRVEPGKEDTLPDFYAAAPLLGDRVERAEVGQKISVDNLTAEVLFIGGERYENPRPNLAINESSMSFRVTGEGLKSVLFLGDLGPEAGKDYLKQYGAGLKSDIVQMAHHGHSGVNEDVYQAIAPESCLWCCADWLWNEPDQLVGPDIWGTVHTRKWMEKLHTVNYVTKDGTQRIPLK